MSAHDPKTTARLWLDYTVRGTARSIQFRYATKAAAIAAGAALQDVIEYIASHFYTSTVFTGLRVAEPGTNVSNPLEWTPVTGSGSGTQALYDTARYSSIVGRSANGSKVRYFLYGLKPSAEVPDDYRVTGEEDASIVATWTEILSFLTSSAALTAGGQAPVMNGYINVGYSAYHQRQLRG